MVMRVVNSAQNQHNINTLRQNKAQMAHYRYQAATGKKGETYAELKGQTAALLRQEDVQKKTNTYINNNIYIDLRLEKVESVINSLNTITKKYQEFLASARGTIAPPGAKFIVTSLLNQVTDQLNSKDIDGRYIFAGTRTNIAPVDLTIMTSTPNSNMVDTSYYKGDNTILQTDIDEKCPMKYGILASDPTFESLIRSLRMAQTLTYSFPIDQSTYSNAYNGLQTAIDSLGGLLAQVGENRANIIQTNKFHQDNLHAVEEAMGKKTDADAAEVITRLSQLEGQINASYYAINKLNNLSLLPFIK